MENLGFETEYVEFEPNLEGKESAYISLAAMLNKHRGGTVYFGVDDNGMVVGMDADDDTLRIISDDIAERIEPRVIPTVEILMSGDSRTYVRIEVQGTDRPYTYLDRYYTRAGNLNLFMPQSELERIFIEDASAMRTPYTDDRQSPYCKGDR